MSHRLPAEGWYLLSDAEVEKVLISMRAGEPPPFPLQRMDPHAALAFRDDGNVPDVCARSLRLILHVHGTEGLRTLDARRAEFEPDFREEPTWRRPGSRAVNLVPLRIDGGQRRPPGSMESWLDDPDVAALEAEWRATGRVAGLTVPAEYRSFVYKTVLSLEGAGRPITVDSVLASVARWLDPDGVATLRRALSGGEVEG